MAHRNLYLSMIVSALLSLALVGAPPRAQAQAVASSADPRATEVGRDILAKGGSAADAAIAMMVTLTLVEPQSSGIGGGGFLVYHQSTGDCSQSAQATQAAHASPLPSPQAAQGKASGCITTIDGREMAPAATQPTRFLDSDGKRMAFMKAMPGGLSVGVPGNMRLAEKAHKQWGKLEWAELFAPAIRLAEEGFRVSPVLHRWMVRFEPIWKDFPEARAIYYIDGKPAPVGTLIRNPAYAKLLRRIAAEGADVFYSGDNAQAIIASLAQSHRNPAVMTRADLDNYQARSRSAVCTSYRSYRLCGMGPPSSGATTVFGILGMLEGYDLATMGKDNPMSWHLLGEAMRFAYADRNLYLGDSDFVEVPLAGLLDKAYLRNRARAISPFGAATSYPAGTPTGAAVRTASESIPERGTSHFVAVDSAGNVASMTSTIESLFGSQLIANGFFLNNQMTDFAFVPEANGAPVANRPFAGKRPLSSMSPTIVYDSQGRVVLAVGSAGGKRIIMHVVKTLIGTLDWGLSAQEAIALPNIYFNKEQLLFEDSAEGRRLAQEMARFGHKATTRSLPSKLNAAHYTEQGWQGAADGRGPGTWATIGADGSATTGSGKAHSPKPEAKEKPIEERDAPIQG